MRLVLPDSEFEALLLLDAPSVRGLVLDGTPTFDTLRKAVPIAETYPEEAPFNAAMPGAVSTLKKPGRSDSWLTDADSLFTDDCDELGIIPGILGCFPPVTWGVMTVGLTVGLPLASVVMGVVTVTSSTMDGVPLLETLCS